MSLNRDIEKLSMLDAKGHKLKIIPAEVTGHFRKYRDWTEAFLVLFFLILPWTKMNGIQTILLDIPSRKFAIFGLVFFAHDGPLLFFLLAILTIGLALLTTLFGRAWCGWACPQTVFIDGVYRRIEILTEGKYFDRRQLDRSPMSLNKFLRGSLKWFLFILVSSIIAHSFIAYFVGAEDLIKMIFADPRLNWWPFILVFSTTGALAFNFGWFREQFCIIMCPYGRFQSVLQDESSVTVAYDVARGEPRKGSADYGQKKGDCVNCFRCVEVCPTGIDIRNGAQMECIACTSCIDACDEIMVKVEKPKGLIRYSSLDGGGVKYLRARVISYTALILIAVMGLSYNIINRSPLEIFILRGKDAPYALNTAADGSLVLMNHMRLHLENQTFKEMNFKIEEPADWAPHGIHLTMPESDIHLPPGHFVMLHFFITAPRELVKGTGKFTTKLDVNGISKIFTIVGPTE